MNVRFGKDIFPYRMLSDSNVILALLTAICSFMWVKNIKLPQSKYLNMVGVSTFGVMLNHANSDTKRRWLWQDLLDNVGHYSDEYFWLRPIVSAACIFVVCVVIDRLRIVFIEHPLSEYIKKRSLQNK